MDAGAMIGAAAGPDPSATLDASALERLRARAAGDPRGAARAAAVQFEAMFLQKVLEGMREGGPRGGMLGDDAGSGFAKGMLDRQLSSLLAGRPGGLADAIASRLAGHVRGAAPAIAGGAEPAGGAGGGSGGRGNGPGGVGSGGTGIAPAGPSAGAGAAARTEGAAGAAAGDRRAAFVDRVWAHAVDAQRATGVRAEFVVGQAALESGWGRGEIRHADGRASHNVFGIKAGRDWNGPTVDVMTTEWVDGRPQKRVERFRAYESYAEAFRDWVGVVGRRARYAGVLRAGDSAEGFASGMQRAGYATDPRYAEKLGGAIRAAQALRRTVA